jgi:hypothetical protein
MIATTLLLTFVSAQQWHRRFYYNDNNCQNALALGIHVYLPGSCNGLPFVCEAKSGLTLKSSESTGCEGATSFSPNPYFKGQKVVPGANYLTLNQYNTPGCTLGAAVEQNTFVADGKCYAVESQDSFYKATCAGTTAKLNICSDPACTSCGGSTLLKAGSFQSTSVTFASACQDGVAMTCSSPAAVSAAGGLGGGTGNVVVANPPSTPTASTAAGQASTNSGTASTTAALSTQGSDAFATALDWTLLGALFMLQ